MIGYARAVAPIVFLVVGMAHAAPPAHPTLDNVLHVYDEVLELRLDVGARLTSEEIGSAVGFAVRWGVTDDLTVFCDFLGVCGRIRAGSGQFLLGGGLLGVRVVQERAEFLPVASLTWQQPVADPVHLALQVRGDLTVDTDGGLTRAQVVSALAVLLQPHERVILSVSAGHAWRRQQYDFPTGVVPAKEDVDLPTSTRNLVALGSVLGRPQTAQPLIQVRIWGGIALLATSRVLLDAPTGKLVEHRHMGGISYSF